MEGTPGLIPKAALTTSRLVYKPFLIPQRLNDSATLVGIGPDGKGGLTGAVKAVNAGIGNAYAALQPRGPAKWLLPLFQKIDAATDTSAAKAIRNKNVFWDPFSQGSEGIGRAIAGPGAYYYAKKAGFPDPSNPDVIKGLLNLKLFQYPVPAPPPPAEQPSGEAPPAAGPPPQGTEGQAAPPPAESGTQAAEGAAQAAAPAA
jgi:hypothetical protein